MNIKQFEYKPLAHFSYAIESGGEMVIIDPERNPIQYYNYAQEIGATIKAVIETHPHADFISSHLQIHEETGATIYNSDDLGATYPYEPFNSGIEIKIGDIVLKAIDTPGHSPESITIIAKKNKETCLFTGDTLFVGDVGRPDLRENSGNIKAKRKELAEMMFKTITEKFNHLPDTAKIYPAHGAGSLCGNNMSDANSSTLGEERKNNWAFKKQSKKDFINHLLDNQPFIPSYFSYNVDLNKKGAENLRPAISTIPFKIKKKSDGLIVDIRNEESFKQGHIKGSFNIQASSKNHKFETWLGAIIKPNETFNIVIDKPNDLEILLERVAKIGYESKLNSVLTLSKSNLEVMDKLNIDNFKDNLSNYTIVDIRNQTEINKSKIFDNALEHPLNELRETTKKIPTNKPIVVHCAGGYRSAAGSSIIKHILPKATVYDLSDAVKQFQ